MILPSRRAAAVLVLAAALAAPSRSATLRAASGARAPSPSVVAAPSPRAAPEPLPTLPGLAPAGSAAPAPLSAPSLETAPLPAPAAVARRIAAGDASRRPDASGLAEAGAPLDAEEPAAPEEGLASGLQDLAETAPEASLPGASRSFDGAAARRALENAAGGGYTVTVLRRPGTDRLAVVLGESHAKSAKAAAAGQQVLSTFSNYAIENYDATSTWARRFNWWLILRERERLTRKQPARFGHGSLIFSASDLAAARRHLLALAPEGRARLLAGARAAVARGTPETVRILVHGRTILQAAQIVAFLEGADAGPTGRDGSRTPPPPATRRFDLEAGHQPDFSESVGVWKPAIDKALPALMLAMPPLMALCAPFATALLVSAVVALAVAVIFFYMKLGRMILSFWPASPLGALFPLETGLIGARDRTMADNLARGVDSLPDGAPLLAILGKGHGPGVRKRMIERHGFEDAGLDALAR